MAFSDDHNEVELYGKLKKETKKAWLVRVDGNEVWLPKSQMGSNTDDLSEGEAGTIWVSEWIATEKGLC